MLALAGMAQLVDGVAAGGFVLDAVMTVVSPGHAAFGEDDARPERAVFQALFDKAACGGLFKVIARFALRQAQGTALRQAQGTTLEGGQVFDIQMDKPWLGDRFKGLAASPRASGGSPCHMMALQAPACRGQGGKSHCVTDFGHGNGA